MEKLEPALPMLQKEGCQYSHHLFHIQLLPSLGGDLHLPLRTTQEVTLLLLQLRDDCFLEQNSLIIILMVVIFVVVQLMLMFGGWRRTIIMLKQCSVELLFNYTCLLQMLQCMNKILMQQHIRLPLTLTVLSNFQNKRKEDIL